MTEQPAVLPPWPSPVVTPDLLEAFYDVLADPMTKQPAILNLRTPIRSERVRGFQPPWHTVYVYRCPAGHETRVRASSFRGRQPEPSVGGIYCPRCPQPEG